MLPILHTDGSFDNPFNTTEVNVQEVFSVLAIEHLSTLQHESCCKKNN